MNNKNEVNINNMELSAEQIKDLELSLQTSLTRQLFIKIEIIDTDNNVISEVSGNAISGSYNIDSSSAIRRTCSVTFKLENGYLPNQTSVFWINKKFKLYIGLKQFNDEVYWFNKGVYAIQDPTISLAISGNQITINGLDKMALYTGDISGQLEYGTMVKAESGTYVHDAIRAIMIDGGETNLLISTTDLKIPYDIESSIGDTRWNIINQFTDLFYNYQTYYNLDGYFVFEKKPMYQSSNQVVNDIAMDFSENYKNDKIQTKPYNLIISLNREIAYSNIKNKIIIYGGIHDDGYQPKYEIIVNDINYSTSPYTIEKLDERNSDGTYVFRTLVVQDETYTDDGSTEGVVDIILLPKTFYKFKSYMANIPSYYKLDITETNNAWGIANDKQCLYYDIVWDGVKYENLIPQKSNDIYYIGNGSIISNLLNNGISLSDTGEPFVIYYHNDNFYIYSSLNDTNSEHEIQILKKETTNHAYSINLCKQRAEQELYLHQQATDKITITCLPIYSLDVNTVIYLNDSVSDIIGEYVITNISCGLSANDTMTITANKLW